MYIDDYIISKLEQFYNHYHHYHHLHIQHYSIIACWYYDRYNKCTLHCLYWLNHSFSKCLLVLHMHDLVTIFIPMLQTRKQI